MLIHVNVDGKMQYYLYEYAKVFCWYILIAGLAYLILWKYFFKRLQSRYLYNQLPLKGDVRREFLYSLGTIGILPLPTVLWFFLKIPHQGLYQDVSEYGVIWFVASFFVLTFLHDTYFYWTHILLHRLPGLRYVHRVHHLSKSPTPFSSLSFHPVEAFIQGLFYPLVSAVIPFQYNVFVAFTFFAFVIDVYGHQGFSLISLDRFKKFPLNLLLHPTHHGHHHENPQGNFSLYFRHWDKLMKTWKGEIIKTKR